MTKDDGVQGRGGAARVALPILALGVLGALLWWLTRPDEGFLVGLVPLSDDEAVLLVRHNASGGARGWAIRAHADGTQLWRTELPGPSESIGAGDGAAVGDDALAVLVEGGPSSARVVLLDRSTGAIRWQREVPGRADGGSAPRIAGDLLLVARSEDRTSTLLALAMSDGAVRFQHRTEDVLQRLRVDPDAGVLAYGALETSLVELGDGPEERAAWRSPVMGEACLEDGALHALRDGALIVTSPRGETRAPLVPAGPPLGVARTCGRRGDDFVFFANEPSEAIGPAHLVIVSRDGAVRRRIELGPVHLSTSGDGPGDDAHHPLRGAISDFVPLLVLSHGGDPRLVVLDLVHGEVAWRSRPDAALVHASAVRGVGALHHVSSSGRILTIDGASGRVVGAVRGDFEGARGGDATEARLWIHSQVWSTHDALPHATLDARSLARIAGPHPSEPTVAPDVEATLTALEVPAAFRAAP